MTQEQYYWNVLRPSMLRAAVAAGYAANMMKNHTLTVNATAIGSANVNNTHFEINGQSYGPDKYGSKISFAKGTELTVKIAGDSSSHIVKINDTDYDFPIDVTLNPFALDSDMTINVVFLPHYV